MSPKVEGVPRYLQILRRNFKQNIKFIAKLGLNLTYCVYFQKKEMTGFKCQCVTKGCASKVFTFSFILQSSRHLTCV